MRKEELRRLMRQRKAQHPHTGHHTGTVPLCGGHTRGLSPCDDAEVILAYSALPDEVPTQGLIDRLLQEGKTVLLPRVVNATDMELRYYTGRHDLAKGAYGVMEPIGDVFTDYDKIDVAIIPGMAFDSDGRRLGRGKGYYDRFLARIPYIFKIGLCFSWQMVDCVPSDEHDIPMDEVIQI